MTKRIIAIMAIALVFFACSKTNEKKEVEKTQTVEVLKVSQVMANPEQYIGKDITVEGMVTHVCQHGGKRLHLSETDSEVKLRVRAGENIGQFERELEGSNVQLSGKFVEERIDQAYVDRLKSGETAEGEHEHHEHEHHEGDHQEGEHEHEEEGQGVSEEFIKEMQAKIDNSEKGYVSEFWLESVKMEKK